MHYQGAIYRPPLEANTVLLQVAVGCAHNRCTFCNMYANDRFQIVSTDIIESDLKELKKSIKHLDRIFLVGGDAFVLSAQKLTEIIYRIHFYFPECKTISMYSAVRNVADKTDEELERLQQLGINDLYVGLETGSDEVLAQVNKGHTISQAKEQMLRLNKANIRHHSLLITGLAGKGKGHANALATASLLNEIKPTIIISTTLGIFPGTMMEEDVKNGKFEEARELENLEEERTLLQNLNLPSTYFWGNHPLNSTPISGVLGPDKNKMISALDHSIKNMDEQNFNQKFHRTSL